MNTYSKNTSFRVHSDPWSYDRIEIRIAVVTNDNGVKFIQSAKPIGFENIDPLDIGKEIAPALRIRREEAQSLMDELWNCGLRPTSGAGSAGQLEAIQNHLKDLQKLVFKIRA